MKPLQLGSGSAVSNGDDVKWRWCVVDGGGGVSQLKWWQLSASRLQMRAGGGGWSQRPQSEHKGSVLSFGHGYGLPWTSNR